MGRFLNLILSIAIKFYIFEDVIKIRLETPTKTIIKVNFFIGKYEGLIKPLMAEQLEFFIIGTQKLQVHSV